MTTKVLMCPPSYYGVDYSINPWMKDNIGKVDKQLASKQWYQLYSALVEHVRVELIDPVDGLPDMVFAANAGKALYESFSPSLFSHEERQGETDFWTDWFVKRRYDINWPNDTFEGEGDCLTDSMGLLWQGYGFRSKKDALYCAFALELKDPRFYHLDTCFCPLNDQKALIWYPDAFKNANRDNIAFSFKKIIEVSEEDAQNFACNAVVIGNKVFLPKNKNVTPQLEAMGYEVQEFDMSEFMKSGGACKCLVLYLD